MLSIMTAVHLLSGDGTGAGWWNKTKVVVYLNFNIIVHKLQKEMIFCLCPYFIINLERNNCASK